MNTMVAYEERELLELISNGDETSFQKIYSKYHQRVYSLAFFLTRSHVLAEDMTQEIFLKVWMQRENLPNIQHFEKWVKELVRNHAYNYLNRMALERRLLADEKFKSVHTATPTENIIADKEFNLLLKKAIDKLPPRQKKIYLLTRMEGVKLETIATDMNLSINTVKNHLKAALSRIRVSLGISVLLLILLLLFY